MFIIESAIGWTLIGCMQTSRLFCISHVDKSIIESLLFVLLPVACENISEHIIPYQNRICK